MLYCSDCDKDVDFKSLDVGGKLTHFCPDCGESNLFKSKDEFQTVVDLLIEAEKKLEEKNKEKLKRKDKIRDGIVQTVTVVLVAFAAFLIIAVISHTVESNREKKAKIREDEAKEIPLSEFQNY